MKSEVGVAVYRHTRLASDDVSLRTTPLLTPGGGEPERQGRGRPVLRRGQGRYVVRLRGAARAGESAVKEMND